MHGSEESKEGEIKPFRSGLHPGGEGSAVQIRGQLESSKVCSHLCMLRERRFDGQGQLIIVGKQTWSFVSSSRGEASCIKREQRTLNETRLREINVLEYTIYF